MMKTRYDWESVNSVSNYGNAESLVELQPKDIVGAQMCGVSEKNLGNIQIGSTKQKCQSAESAQYMANEKMLQ